eukprot:997100-Pyramimonas_sp.AAC.1
MKKRHSNSRCAISLHWNCGVSAWAHDNQNRAEGTNTTSEAHKRVCVETDASGAALLTLQHNPQTTFTTPT